MEGNKNTQEIPLDHFEGFELEKEYRLLCDKLRFHKLDIIDRYAQQIIRIFETYIDGKFLVSHQYLKVSMLYRNMRIASFFYMSKDVRKTIALINPKYEDAFSTKSCRRTLKYMGDSNANLTQGHLYESMAFNGWFYTVKDNQGEDVSIWFTRCERLS